MKDKTIKIRLTGTEEAMLKEICEHDRTNMSEFLREAIRGDYEALYPQKYAELYPQNLVRLYPQNLVRLYPQNLVLYNLLYKNLVVVHKVLYKKRILYPHLKRQWLPLQVKN